MSVTDLINIAKGVAVSMPFANKARNFLTCVDEIGFERDCSEVAREDRRAARRYCRSREPVDFHCTKCWLRGSREQRASL